MMAGCNVDRPYAFISYSHDEEDKQQVMAVVTYFRNKGYNIWTDELLHHTHRSWKVHIGNVLNHENCKVFVYFRSRRSLVKWTIAHEIRHFDRVKDLKKDYDNKHNAIVIFDLYPSQQNEAVYAQIAREEEDSKLESFYEIEEYISADANALTFENEWHREKFEDILKSHSCITYDISKMSEEDGLKASKPTPVQASMIETAATTVIDATEPVAHSPTTPSVSKGRKAQYFAINHRLFTTKNQNELMYTVYRELLTAYPHRIEQVLAEQNHVSQTDYENPENVAALHYFDSCQTMSIHGMTICVGASFGFNAKKAQINKLCDIIGIPRETIRYLTEEQYKEAQQQGGLEEKLPDWPPAQDHAKPLNAAQTRASTSGKAIQFTVFQQQYEAIDQSDFMGKVYDILLNKYPEKLDGALTQLSNVFERDEATYREQEPENLNMRSYRIIRVQGRCIAIGTSYNFKNKLAAIRQLCKVLDIPNDSVEVVS